MEGIKTKEKRAKNKNGIKSHSALPSFVVKEREKNGYVVKKKLETKDKKKEKG